MKTAVLFFFLLLGISSSAQIKGEKYSQDDMITWYHEISKYDLKNVDTLVDIGSGSAKHAALVFKFFPKKHYTLVDIDPRFKKRPYESVNTEGRRYYFEKQSEFVLSSDSTIPLPSSKFRRVLCRQTFHEFSKPEAMLAEMKRVLADDGLLIVVEAKPEFENQTDPGCKHVYWKKEELVEVFERNGFKLVGSDVTMYDLKKVNTNLNILKFKKS